MYVSAPKRLISTHRKIFMQAMNWNSEMGNEITPCINHTAESVSATVNGNCSSFSICNMGAYASTLRFVITKLRILPNRNLRISKRNA